MENTYIVKKNDNLYDIAKEYNTTVGILKALNNLSSNILQVGQILKLPTSLVEETIPGDYLIYTIKKGDNLYSIAKNYNITLDELINFNQQGSTLLHIGEQLLIPINNQTNNNIQYVIKPGDTLYNIAKRYNTNVDEIKKINNLNSNMLKIGETILIPGTSNYQTYVIRTNDTLEGIALRYNTTVENIMKANNLLTDDVTVGQIILIPSRI